MAITPGSQVPNAGQSHPDLERNQILERVAAEADTPGLFETLMRVPNADFQSLMLALMERKAEESGVKELNFGFKNNHFIRVSEVDQRSFIEFDNLAYSLLPKGYKSVELSPLVPSLSFPRRTISLQMGNIFKMGQVPIFTLPDAYYPT